MAQTVVPAEVKANGELRLPKPVRKALHLRGKGGLVGFVIARKRVLLSNVAIVPKSALDDEEIAALAHLSKRAVGKRTFRTTEQALRHLWSL